MHRYDISGRLRIAGSVADSVAGVRDRMRAIARRRWVAGSDEADQLREQREYTRAVIDTASSVIVATDLKGLITVINADAEELLGLTAEEARGRPFVDLVAGRGSTFADLVAPTERTEPRTQDLTWLPPGRTPVHVLMTTNALRNTSEEVIGYLFVATDVTDSRRSQEILVRALAREQVALARLRDLDRAKDDFVSTVSHELRTPMSSILGSAEMLSDGMLGELEPEQASVVEVISRNGDRLLALAEDLLLLVAFDQSTWVEHHVVTDLRVVVAQSLESIAEALAHRDLRVEAVTPDSAVPVLGDAGHLERAVTNLLTNAVKFTADAGTIEVRVRTEDARLGAVLEVADTGLGIPPDDLEAVFRRFFRSPEAEERAIQGSGLGLAIVKSVVETHGGRVEVSSREGVGSTFTVRLPLA